MKEYQRYEIPIDPSTFSGRTWAMIFEVKNFHRKYLDLYLGVIIQNISWGSDASQFLYIDIGGFAFWVSPSV